MWDGFENPKKHICECLNKIYVQGIVACISEILLCRVTNELLITLVIVLDIFFNTQVKRNLKLDNFDSYLLEYHNTIAVL